MEGEAGDGAGARRTLELAAAAARASRDTKYGTAWAWREIATASARLGDIDAAKATAAGITEVELQAEAYCGIAAVQVAKGDAAGARQCFHLALIAADCENDLTGRDKVRAAVAARARAGDVAGAVAVAETLRQSDAKARAYSAVATARAEAGDAAAAKTTAGLVPAGESRRWACHAIGNAHAKAGDLPAIEGWVNSLHDPGEVALALLGAAEGRLPSGE